MGIQVEGDHEHNGFIIRLVWKGCAQLKFISTSLPDRAAWRGIIINWYCWENPWAMCSVLIEYNMKKTCA